MVIPDNVSVFVLNLERDSLRREHMQQLLAKLGIKAEFVKAIYGKDLSQEARNVYDRKKTLRVYGSDMLDNELGCYLSHYSIYERVVRDGLPYALVFEDDIDIQETLPSIVTDLVSLPNPEWLVVRLDTMRIRVREPKSKKFTGKKVQTLQDGALFKLNTHALGAGAYLISLAGAKRMQAYGRNIFMPIDQTMDRFWENGITPYVVRPFPVKQLDSFETSIGARPPGRHKGQSMGHYLLRRWQRVSDGIRKRWYGLVN